MGFVLWRFLFSTKTTEEVDAKAKSLSLRNYWTGMKGFSKNRNFIILSFLSGLRAMTQMGLATFLPIYLVKELSLSPALVGGYIAIMQGAGMASPPISGLISDKKGRKPFNSQLALKSILITDPSPDTFFN